MQWAYTLMQWAFSPYIGHWHSTDRWDDLTVVVTTSVGFGGGVTGIDNVTGGEATSEMLSHQVHVGQVSAVDDFQV
jgi:hypothetical protein